MAQIEINQKSVVVSEGQILSEIYEFRKEYEKILETDKNPKVWVRNLGADSAFLVSPNAEGFFDYEVKNGDTILVEHLSRYGR